MTLIFLKRKYTTVREQKPKCTQNSKTNKSEKKKMANKVNQSIRENEKRIDFRRRSGKQEEHLKDIMNGCFETIVTLRVRDYIIETPSTEMWPLWTKLTQLEISSTHSMKVRETIYAPFFEAMISLKRIKIQNIVAFNENKNICDALPNNEIEETIYDINKPINWRNVIEQKQALKSLTCDLLPNFRLKISGKQIGKS